MCLFALMVVVKAQVLIFTVNSIGDLSDEFPGNGVCLTDAGDCTLRAAIEESNALAGAQNINFNIPGAGVQTIAPTSALPSIIGVTVIDAATQPGYAGTPLIFLDGTNAGAAANGLTATAQVGIRGLAIGNFAQGSGIALNGGADSQVQSCYLGLNPTGAQAANNIGLTILAPSAIIGGTTAVERNIISGNLSNGININGASATNNVISGNYIGTNPAGSAAISNGSYGVRIGDAINTQLGDATTGGGNVIAANVTGDILVTGTTNGTQIQNNFIGINAAGTASLNPNPAAISTGITVQGASPVLIGGTAANTTNVIAGHTNGITTTSSQPVTIQGSTIGLNAARTATIAINGIGIQAASNNNVIGGTLAAARNVIGGCGNAIQLNGNNNTVQGNSLGTNAAGTATNLGNSAGIFIFDGTGNIIGGIGAGEANIIAYNTLRGVGVRGINSANGNPIRGNSIHDNGTGSTGLGIDLANNGVTANDAGDADTGPNNFQNFPVITSVTGPTAGAAKVDGTLNSTPNTNFVIDIYSNTVADASGFGEGTVYFGSVNAITDSIGNATFTLTASGDSGDSFAATATDASGNTSEFSAAPTNLPTLSINDVTVTEGNTGTSNAVFTVTLSAASIQTITVDFATANNTATQPADYTQTNGTLTIPAGNTTGTIIVPVVGDTLDEANETFFVNLTNPANATIAGAPSGSARGVGTITDNDAAPTIRVNDVTVSEGNASTANATFTVSLSALSGRNITVNYAAANGTATAPADYTATTGTLTFPAGSTTERLRFLL